MGKLIKIVLATVLVLIVLVVVAVVFLVSNLDDIVKRVVEQVGSDTMGTEVTLDSAEISLGDANGTLSGLTIANPDGFESANAFQLGAITIGIDPSAFSAEEIVLPQVVVDQAHLTFEQKGDRNNLQTLLDALESGPEETGEAEEPEATLVIQEFRLSGAKVTVIHDRLDEPLDLTLADIVLKDIGRVGAGETAASAAKQIIEPILDRTVDAAKKRAEDELRQRVEQEVEKQKQDAVDSLKDKLLGDG